MTDQYRNQLALKLKMLIATLELALTKIERSMDLPGADVERLEKISGNLENTRTICNRALNTLQQQIDGTIKMEAPPSSGMRAYIELMSIAEYQKFKSLPPIKPEEVANTDIDRLIERF